MQRFEISIDKYLYDMIMEYFHRYLDVTDFFSIVLSCFLSLFAI